MAFKFKTLNGIARAFGAKAFKHYAHDYGNERVNVNGSVWSAINVLDRYRDTESLIEHFNSLYSYPDLIWQYKDLYNK